MDYDTVLGTQTINGTEYPVTVGFLTLLFVKNIGDIIAVHTYLTGDGITDWVFPVAGAVFMNILVIVEFRRDVNAFHGN